MKRSVSQTPNLFLVGAPKCGTTSMARYLGHHPEIFVPEKKEPFFLASDFEHSNKIRTEAEYTALYAEAETRRYACDGSTFYLFSRTAASAIYERCPEAKIIVMLRAPVRQMVSMFQHNVVRGNEDQTDMARALALQADRAKGRCLPAATKSPQVLQYEAIADYAPQVARYFEVFDPAQIHIEIFEDFVSDTHVAMARTLAFLELDLEAMPADAFSEAQNVTAEAARPRSHQIARIVGTKTGPLGAAKRLLPQNLKQVLRSAVNKVNTSGTGAGDVILPDAALRADLQARVVPQVAALEVLIQRDLSLWYEKEMVA